MSEKKKDAHQGQDYTDWYGMWLEQSKAFFDSANENLQTLFAKGKPFDPEEHMKQVEMWLEKLKKQWQFSTFSAEQKMNTDYIEMMTKMMNDATDLMLRQWAKKVRDNDPIKNIHDLYALWLSSCHETYQRYMHSRTFQEAYGDFMNTMFKFWKSNIPE